MARPSARVTPASTAKSPTPRRQAARSRIDDEHRQLGELLLSLVHTHDLHRVDETARRRSAPCSSHHFEGEEGGAGSARRRRRGCLPPPARTCSTSSTSTASSSPASTRCGGDGRGARRSGDARSPTGCPSPRRVACAATRPRRSDSSAKPSTPIWAAAAPRRPPQANEPKNEEKPMPTTHETAVETAARPRTVVRERIVEIVSDSGEGAQKAGQTFGTVCAKMGNGVWTVEIIPAEIKPPARSRAGACGIRVRFGCHEITNCGDERRPGGRLQRAGALRPHRQRRLRAGHRRAAREQVGARTRRRRSASSTRPRSPSSAPRASTSIELPHGGGLPRGDARRARRQEHVRRSACSAEIFGRDMDKALARRSRSSSARRAPRSSKLNQELLRHGCGVRRRAACRIACAGAAAAPSHEPLLVMNGNQARRPRRPRRRHGAGRDVPDHAGDLGLALPGACLRQGRRLPAPGRGRDRRDRLRDRRLLRRQDRLHDHLRPGPRAQDRVPRLRRRWPRCRW